MDKYTKAVLTVIAVSLIVIAIRLVESEVAYAGVLSGGPTWGDYRALREIKDTTARRQAHISLRSRIPLVWVSGGQVNAEVSGGQVDVSGSVSIEDR